MLGALLGGGRSPQQIVSGHRIGRDHVGERHLPLGERARLVEHHRVDALRALQDLAAFDEDAQSGAPPGPDHDRRRRGQAEGAGAGDDEDRHRRHQPLGGVPASDPPSGEGRQGDDEDHRDKDGRDAVGQPLHRGPGALGLFNQVHDLGQGGVGPHRCGGDGQHALGIDRGSRHLVTRLLVDGHRLAGQHRLVDGRGAVDDLAVDGDLLARADA